MGNQEQEYYKKRLDEFGRQIAQLDEEQRQIDELAKDTDVFVDAALTLLEVREHEAAREADDMKSEVDRINAETEEMFKRMDELVMQSRATRGK